MAKALTEPEFSIWSTDPLFTAYRNFPDGCMSRNVGLSRVGTVWMCVNLPFARSNSSTDTPSVPVPKKLPSDLVSFRGAHRLPTSKHVNIKQRRRIMGEAFRGKGGIYYRELSATTLVI